uniref:TTF-type domain-containing protein n=1 Tax=Latimeria chalumnae TaxID=7897 RepID=H3A5Q3_LATCH
DPGMWSPVTEELRSYWVTKGTDECQHADGDFSASERKYEHEQHPRRCTRSMFQRVYTKSGEVSERKWLIYSPTTGSVYCFACKLFSNDQKNHFGNAGFQDWKHADRALSMHENSECHRRAMVSLTTHMDTEGRIDKCLVTQYRAEKQYWCDVLHRILKVVRFLAERGLALHGENEIFGSPHNGNFLGIVELIVKYDAFLAQHINKHGNMGRGHVPYLSSTICEVFIALLEEKVFEHIVKELKEAKYFSVLVDSIPDISNLDQLTCVVRYVLPNGPVERFLTFLDFETHSGQDIAKSLLQFFEKIGVNIADCQGQSYDNASNLSGKYQGMQAWIRERSENAVYIPCCAHSLNLVGQCAVDCCFTAISFFSFVQKLYFFAASTKRWKVLLERLAETNEKLPVVKNLSETRWSVHTDAVTALRKGYDRIKATLDHLSCDDSQKPDTRIEKTMEKLEISIMTEIWHTILERFHKTSAKLQDPKMDFNTAPVLLESLHAFINSLRSQFSHFEEQGKNHKSCVDYYRNELHRRRKRNRQYDDGESEETQLLPCESFRIETYLVIMDKLSSALAQRLDAYKEVCSRFGFLSKLTSMSVGEIHDTAKKLLQYYSTYLEDCVIEELVHFSEFVKTEFARKSSGDGPEIQMYRLLVQNGLQDTFPNIHIILHMYLCLMILNCSGEHSFSKMVLIKNRLRSTMHQERLNMLTLMSIEHEILRTIDFSDLINDFAERKARKRPL